MIRSASTPLAAALVVVVAAFAGWTALGPVPERMAASQLAFGVASAAWLLALALVARGRGDARRGDLSWIALAAIALRGLALVSEPELSDDVHRYVWEGALVAEGISPWAHAPDAPERARERERWPEVHARVNHPSVSAAYPPLAQAVFAATVAAAGGAEREGGRAAVRLLRVLFAGADLAVLVVLARALRAHGRDPRWCVAWGASPLAAAEFGGAAHYDVLAILALVLSLAAWRSGRGRVAAALAGAGGLIKVLPLVAAPWMVRGRGAARRAAVLVLTLALGAGWVLLLEGGARGLPTGLSEYGLRWESTSALYRFVEPLLPACLERDRGPGDPRRIGRALVTVVWFAIAIRQWRRRVEPARATATLVRAALVLAPTLHPWYATWSLPFLALFPSRAWALLAALAPLLHWPLAGWRAAGTWAEPAWLWFAVFPPFFLLWAWERLGRSDTFRA